MAIEGEPVKNRAAGLLARLEQELEAGTLDEAGWYREVAAVLTPAYLAGQSPRSQSGHSGDAAHWRQARELVLDAVERDGTFLDVGCANGHLLECLEAWAAERGRTLELFGLEISPELADLARHRLPHYAARIYEGNAIAWEPPRQYDFVRTGLEYVPARRRPDLIRHLLTRAVAPGGRLIIGTYNEEAEPPGLSLAQEVECWGFAIAGRTERPHHRDRRLRYKTLWIEVPGIPERTNVEAG